MTTNTESAGYFPDPAVAYANAPSIIQEIGWITATVANRRNGGEIGREFWLRKAAVVDRIALQEVATYAPEVAITAVQTAEATVLKFIEYEVAHSGLSLKGAELITAEDRFGYVREQYHVWSHTQLH
ncbi:hypothetical protein [Streptomyces microflavus]|uniref:hypothetical protein n=1 Tax=Streptomyces microflavus TaxID=1919 RepID=UPI00364DB506